MKNDEAETTQARVLRAKVTLDEQDAVHLIRVFFEEFNPESSIGIKGNEACLEIFFEKDPPEEIIKTIRKCESINEFCYGKSFEEMNKQLSTVVIGEETFEESDGDDSSKETHDESDGDDSSEETPEESDEDNSGEETPEETGEGNSADKKVAEGVISKRKKRELGKKGKAKLGEVNGFAIPELVEAAKKTSSFKNFVKSVVDNLVLDQNRKKCLVLWTIAATQVKVLNWSSIEASLKMSEIFYTQYDKVKCNHVLNEKFNLSTLQFIKAMLDFEDFDFKNPEVKNEKEEIAVTDISETTNTEVENLLSNHEDESENQRCIAVSNISVATVNGFEIPELMEIAKKASSFKSFIECVGMYFLNLNEKRFDYFYKLILVSAKLDNLSWKDINSNFDGEEAYTCTNRVECNEAISKKLNLTFMQFIKAMLDYMTYDFEYGTYLRQPLKWIVKTKKHSNKEKAEIPVINTKTDEDSSESILAGEETPVEERFEDSEIVSEDETTPTGENEESTDETSSATKPRIRLKCMPEIPEFEEVLGSIDKSLHIVQRVKVVAVAMGWNFASDLDNRICDAFMECIKLKDIDRKINDFDWLPKRMIISDFVSNFVKKHGYNQKIRAIDFIKQLQNVVFTEEELNAL